MTHPTATETIRRELVLGKRRAKPQVAEDEKSDDPLGVLYKTYRLEWPTVFYAIFMFLFAVFAALFIPIFLFGAAFGGLGEVSSWVAYSLFALFLVCVITFPIAVQFHMSTAMQDAGTYLPGPLRLALYGLLILFTIYRLIRNIPNLWRRLEVRQHGLRYVQFGFATEICWRDVVDIDVTRYDRILHPFHFQLTTNSDETSPSLTKADSGYTEFQVVISDREGESIRLSRSFMSVVANPQKLIASFRKHVDRSDG